MDDNLTEIGQHAKNMIFIHIMFTNIRSVLVFVIFKYSVTKTFSKSNGSRKSRLFCMKFSHLGY